MMIMTTRSSIRVNPSFSRCLSWRPAAMALITAGISTTTIGHLSKRRTAERAIRRRAEGRPRTGPPFRRTCCCCGWLRLGGAGAETGLEAVLRRVLPVLLVTLCVGDTEAPVGRVHRNRGPRGRLGLTDD